MKKISNTLYLTMGLLLLQSCLNTLKLPPPDYKFSSGIPSIPSEGIVLKMESEEGRLFLPVQMEGETWYLLFSTATGYNYIDSRYLTKIGASPKIYDVLSQIPLTQSTTGMGLVEIPTLSIQGLQIKKMQACIWDRNLLYPQVIFSTDERKNNRILGIISSGFLAKTYAEISYTRNELVLSRENPGNPQLKEWELSWQTPRIGRWEMVADLKDASKLEQSTLVIDTAMSINSLLKGNAQMDVLRAEPQTMLTFHGKDFDLPWVKTWKGKFALPELPMLYSPLEDTARYTALVGYNDTKKYDWFLDYSKRKFGILRKSPSFDPDNLSMNGWGVLFQFNSGVMEINSVLQIDGKALVDGVEPGDRVKTLDGKDSDLLQQLQAAALAKRSITIEIEKNGSLVQKVLSFYEGKTW